MEVRSTDLTDKSIKALQPDKVTYRVWDKRISGYHVLVHPTSRKTLYYRYSLNGRRPEYKIGRYGEVTATQARTMATKLAGQVAAGIDVQADRQNKRAKAKNTLGAFVLGPYD